MADERILIEALMSGDTVALTEMIEATADRTKFFARKFEDPAPTNHAFGHDATPLQFASYRERNGPDTVRLLIEHGAKVDLHSACGLGLVERIVELIAADPNGINQQVDTYFPIQFAITAARADAVDCLLQHGDDPNRDLQKVAYFGWEDKTRDQDYTPWKPIHMASLYGFDATRIPVAESLMKHGADLDALSPLDGYRPIHLVAMPNRVDLIRFYVENGVEVDSRTAKCKGFESSKEDAGPLEGSVDNTPLMVASGEGFVEATECLLELGADVNACNSRGQTPLHCVAKRFWNGQPYDAVIELLLSRGADRSKPDDQGKLPAI